MNFSAWSIRHPVPPIAIFLVLVMMGFYSFSRLAVTAMPNIDLPLVSVVVNQPGAAPSELTRQVIQPIEDSIASITGVRHITSAATDSSARIYVEFELETDTDRAVNDVKDAVANVRADLRQVAEGMAVTPLNVSGSLRRDRGRIIDHLGRFLPVGFYYRTFFGPRRTSWLKLWEPIIRASAGLGTVSLDPAPRRYLKETRHCDVLVVGAGPAGLAAAIAAAEAGADVILAEKEPELGGALTYARFGVETADAARHLDALRRKAAAAGIAVLSGATCNGHFADNWLPVLQGDRLIRIRAAELVLAQVESQREANRLMTAEMDKGGTWTWAWRPATMWILIGLWIWSLVAVPIANAIAGAALPLFLAELTWLTMAYMGLYMGGHTVKEGIEKWASARRAGGLW